MNDQPKNSTETPEPKSWREERWERRQARRAAIGSQTRGGALVAGLLLVLLGVIFLLQNSGYYFISLKNWGALFILIPAVGAFDRAYRIYRYEGNQLTAPARAALIIGLVLLLITLIILFNLNWSIWGPALIILVGISLLFGSFFPNHKE
jgi:hypothetical protein